MISDLTEKPLASWRGKERFGSNLLDCLTIIFKTGGCSYAKCRMCSYRHERYAGESCASLLRHLESQLVWVKEQYDLRGYRMVKIFTSGSLFDPVEVPPAFLSKIASAFRGKLLIAETRPDFVCEEVLLPFISMIDDGSWETPVYCAIGLETSSDPIREKCINKGFTFRDFTTAVRQARGAGAGIKAYLLLKPLFLTEAEAVSDMLASITDTLPCTDWISMNPCTVQRNTELEYYWKRGAYRPPYLWSVLSVLSQSPVPVTCDPLGGGQRRGPHNCGGCDDAIVKGIRDYSLSGDRELVRALLDIDCDCRQEWEFVLDSEKPWCMPLTR